MQAASIVTVVMVVVSFAVGANAEEHRSRAVTREFQREHPCPSTGLMTGRCPGYIKDHVIPLCAGGPDAVSNMQWQTVADSKDKDRLERRECAAQ
jgi:hypothetical protein